MSVEVEMKFACMDLAGLEDRLRRLGARPGSAIDEADHYFNAPDRDFAKTDEALRLRRIGPANFITYKGPKRDLQTKTRTEVEVPLGDGDAVADAFTRLATHLGYRSVAVVSKRRRTYQLDKEGFALEICLDEVSELGSFAEVEIVTTEDRLNRARELLIAFAAEVGLTGSERRSYLELLLATRQGRRA